MAKVQFFIGELQFTIDGVTVIEEDPVQPEEKDLPEEPTDDKPVPEDPDGQDRTEEEVHLFKLRANGYFNIPRTFREIDQDHNFNDAALEVALQILVDENYLIARKSRFGNVMWMRPKLAVGFDCLF